MIELGNLRLPSGKKSFIQILGSVIVGLTEKAQTTHWIDCKNGLALPGLVDMHVHDRFGQPEKETPESLVRAAILGGVTTFAKMPNTLIPATTAEIIERRAVQDLNSKPTLNTQFWLGATTDNASEIVEAAKHLPSVVCGVKVYMGSSTGNLLVTEPSVLLKIFQCCAAYDLVVGVHAEDEALMKKNLQNLGRAPTIPDHCVIRSTEVEVSAVRTALCLQEQANCQLYFCHVSTPESLELIMDAKNRGRTVYAEVCPHHLYLNQESLQGNYGGRFKMNPPLRTVEQVKRLRELTCQPGWVDVISTDHAPHILLTEKDGQPYDKTASGVPGIQTMLPLMFSFVRTGSMTLGQFVKLTSANAASIFGLTGKGQLGAGDDADITVIDDREIESLHNYNMATKEAWTPFDGLLGIGFPTLVMARGQLLYPDMLIDAGR
jgi:dihydroorotase